MKNSEIKNAFLNPEALDRSAPFWSWNDVMKPAEVKEQAKDMIAKGGYAFTQDNRCYIIRNV